MTLHAEARSLLSPEPEEHPVAAPEHDVLVILTAVALLISFNGLKHNGQKMNAQIMLKRML